MTQGIHPLAANMINQLNRVDTISNNLANTNTVGFKSDHLAEGTFNRYLDDAMKDKKEPSKLSELMDTVPKINCNYTSNEVGSLMVTGNKLDFAITDPNKYFKIQNKSGEVLYTRDGAFKNTDGFLVNHNGNKIVDKDNQPIELKDGFESNLFLVEIDPKNLKKVGNNDYQARDSKKIEVVENSDQYLTQRSLESSNVDSITSMVSLIEAQRKFEQSQKAISAIDEVNGKLIDKIGYGI